MNCPSCGNIIASLGRHCGSCRYDFGEELHDKFSFYFGLKDEFERLAKLQNSLYAGIANVSGKIQKYEEVLRRDLRQQASSATKQYNQPQSDHTQETTPSESLSVIKSAPVEAIPLTKGKKKTRKTKRR